jgi:tripartite-type tricarboxylate transporter receptor subunit TctC
MTLMLWLLLLLVSASSAIAQSHFYQGKTITVAAGANAGSTYDLYVRLMTGHMGKYIPGNPNFIVQKASDGFTKPRRD